MKQYLNIIRILHLECNFPNPCADSWFLKTTLRGIEKAKGTEICRKKPFTPELLLRLKYQIRFSNPVDYVFWAACLIMFFGLLRKSNLFGTDTGGFKSDKHLTRSCIVISHDCSYISFTTKWSKSNQTQSRKQKITLHRLPNHPLCPVVAVVDMFRMTTPTPPDSPAFPMTGASFNRKLRSLTAAFSDNISSHSFRRGGATWALSCGIPGEIVKAMGDWQSACYLLYLDQLPQFVIDHFRHQFGECLPPKPPTGKSTF